MGSAPYIALSAIRNAQFAIRNELSILMVMPKELWLWSIEAVNSE